MCFWSDIPLRFIWEIVSSKLHTISSFFPFVFLIRKRRKREMQLYSSLLVMSSSSVQFSSRWYLCARKSPYAFHPVSQTFSQRCLWNGSNVRLILIANVLFIVPNDSPHPSRKMKRRVGVGARECVCVCVCGGGGGMDRISRRTPSCRHKIPPDPGQRVKSQRWRTSFKTCCVSSEQTSCFEPFIAYVWLPISFCHRFSPFNCCLSAL